MYDVVHERSVLVRNVEDMGEIPLGLVEEAALSEEPRFSGNVRKLPCLIDSSALCPQNDI